MTETNEYGFDVQVVSNRNYSTFFQNDKDFCIVNFILRRLAQNTF